MAPAEDRPDVALFHEIRQIEHYLRASIARELPEGLTYPQFEVLNHIAQRGDCVTPAGLAQALLMTKGAITNTLQRMEAEGLIAMLADVSDRRKKRVTVTPKGRQAHLRTMVGVKPKLDSLREGFTEREFRDALPLLKALSTFMAETAAA